MLYDFQYMAPKSSKELLSILEEKKDACSILAGGTDLLVDIRAGIKKPNYLIDIKQIKEFNSISFSKKEGLHIGAAVTISDIIENKDMKKHFPILCEAAHHLGSAQVRNKATVVGNICNASPCADLMLPLLCLDASLHISSHKGSREVKIKDFATGVKKTILKDNEIVEKIFIPISYELASFGYEKLKRIKGHDLALVSVCMIKKGKTIRIAIGSAAPTAVLLKDFSTKDSLKNIQNEAGKKVSPIDDVRASKEYRLFMINEFIEKLLKKV